MSKIVLKELKKLDIKKPNITQFKMEQKFKQKILDSGKSND